MESMLVANMEPPVRTMVLTLAAKMKEKNLGIASSKLERYAILFDPRYKGSTPCMSKDTFKATVDELKEELLALYPEDLPGQQQQEERHPDEAEVLGQQRLQQQAGGMQPPAGNVDKLRMRRQQRAANLESEARERNYLMAASSCMSELCSFLSAPLEKEADGFSLTAYWKEKAYPKLDESGKQLAPAVWPKLAKFAARYVSLEATSCEAERNFSALSEMLDDRRSRLKPPTVEKCMMLRLNRRLIPGFEELAALEEHRQATAAETKRMLDAAAAAQRKAVLAAVPAAAAAASAARKSVGGGGYSAGGGSSAAGRTAS